MVYVLLEPLTEDSDTDTDGDGPTDWEEFMEYRTDPLDSLAPPPVVVSA